MSDLDQNAAPLPRAVAGDTLNRQMTRGAAWMIGLRFTDRFVGFISTIVLARLLVPADFGLIALSMAMVAAIAIFGEFGFEMALIQNQKAERRHYDTAWTLTVIRGAIAALIIAVLAEPLAGLFNDPRLTGIVLVLALMPLMEGFYNIGTVAFRKELTLHKEFVFRMVPRLVGVVATISLAIAWRNYWALVYGTLIATAMRLMMSYVMHPFRPRLSLKAFREIMDFSKWMVANSIVNFANRKGDTVIIGKFLDAAALGSFALSRQISNMASAELVAPIKQALFPGYAKLAHDTILLRQAFLDAYGILATIALPIAIGIGLTAEYFVPLLLGPNWLATIPLIEILVVSGGIGALASHVRPVYLAMNLPKYGLYASVGRVVVLLPMLYFGVRHFGILGAAVAQGFAQLSVLLVGLYLMRRLLGLRLQSVLAACWRPILACALMVLVVIMFKSWVPESGSDMASQAALLATAVLSGALTYCASLAGFWALSGKPRNSAEAHILKYMVAHVARQKRVGDA